MPDGIDIDFNAQPALRFTALGYVFKRENPKTAALRRRPAARLKTL